MRYPWANTVLLLLLTIQFTTGVGGLITGSEGYSWILWLHGVAAYAVTALIYWKGLIIFDAFKRRWCWSLGRFGFILLTVLLLATLVTGFLWSYGGPLYLSGLSLIVLHGFLAVLLIGFLAWHTAAKLYVWRIPHARSRRTFFRLATFGLAGLAVRQLAEPAKIFTTLPGAARRFTGSYEVGSFTGIFPVTSWLFDRPQPIAIATWRLVVEGAVECPLRLSYSELKQLASDTETALLDCTGGFYTTQAWRGVYLMRLLDMAGVKPEARSVTVEAVSGYGRRFSLATARTCLLATEVADQPLIHGHGLPLRLVVPGQRGYDWVKWVARIRLNETSQCWQPPLPLQ